MMCVCSGRLVRKSVRLSVHRCGEGAWLSSHILYVSPKSTSNARMPPRPNVYGSSLRWWCTLRTGCPCPGMQFVLNELLLPLQHDSH